MYQYRQILVRMRRGDSDRDIARSKTMGRKKILSGDPSEKADRDVLEAMIDLNGAIKLPVGMRVTVEFLR